MHFSENILNDEIELGLDGSLIKVGPDSLAAHIGLEVGDIVQATARHAEVIEAGGVAEIPVVRDGATHRVLEVSLDLPSR